MTARASCQFGLKCIDEQITLGLLKRLETHRRQVWMASPLGC